MYIFSQCWCCVFSWPSMLQLPGNNGRGSYCWIDVCDITDWVVTYCHETISGVTVSCLTLAELHLSLLSSLIRPYMLNLRQNTVKYCLFNLKPNPNTFLLISNLIISWWRHFVKFSCSDAVFMYYFCGVAVFRDPPCPPLSTGNIQCRHAYLAPHIHYSYYMTKMLLIYSTCIFYLILLD